MELSALVRHRTDKQLRVVMALKIGRRRLASSNDSSEYFPPGARRNNQGQGRNGGLPPDDDGDNDDEEPVGYYMHHDLIIPPNSGIVAGDIDLVDKVQKIRRAFHLCDIPDRFLLIKSVPMVFTCWTIRAIVTYLIYL